MTRPFLAVMDPPWSADNGGGGRGAQNHYAIHGVPAIVDAVRGSGHWINDGSALVWMWATSRALVLGHAHDLAVRLGLRVCAGFVWAKVDLVTNDTFTRPARPGLGQWQRTEHEHLLVCRRGDVKVPDPAARSRSIVYAARGKHSAKPDKAWRVIESTSESSIGRRHGVEFFARTARPGWVAWGTLNGGDDVVTITPKETP